MNMLDLEPSESYSCAICKHVLLVMEDDKGHTWVEHHGASPKDHNPQPVPSSAVKTILFCDFCFEINPTWEFPCRSFRIGNVRSWDAWHACDVCTGLVLTDNWTTMLSRATSAHQHIRRQQGLPPYGWLRIGAVQAALVTTWRGFQQARTGEPERLA